MEKQREFFVSGCSLAAVALLRSKHHENKLNPSIDRF
jgi:hypothetical protein